MCQQVLNKVMNLHELEIKQRLQDTGTRQLQAVLAQYGWHPLGYGAEATVALHPERKYVLKLFPRDSLYMHFLQMVKQDPTNPHFPKFSREVRDVPGTKYSYVRMERLNRVMEYDLVNDFPQLLCLLDKFYNSFHKWPPTWVRMNVSWDPIWGSSGAIDCNNLDITAQERAVFHLLTDKTRQLGWDRVDMHASNFMARGNTWVLTDPFI